MTARIEHQDNQTAEPHCAVRTGEIVAVASLLGSPPEPIEIGAGAVVLLDGTLDVEGPPVDGLRIRLGELEQDVEGYGVPPPPGEEGTRWWASVEVPPSAAKGLSAVSLLADVGGTPTELDLGSLELIERLREPEAAEVPSESRIAICMATYEPAGDQLRRQIDSIRAQTRGDWICLISDDASSEKAFAELQEVIGDDRRFVVSRAPERLGFLRNFERSLRMVPPGIELIALSDQDDRWDDDKLEALVDLLDRNPAASLAYSDMRIATMDGEILSDTYWYLRRNSYDDMASMLVANTVTGAASVFRRTLLDVALPFPPANRHAIVYHDHWLALCALAGDEIVYLDRPTHDYTRHPDSITMRAQSEWLAPPQGTAARVNLRWRRMTRRIRMRNDRPSWRDIYLGRYLLIRQLASMLELRLGDRLGDDTLRDLRRFDSAQRSPIAMLWLLGRALRPLIGRNETLGSERVLIGGLLWRRSSLKRARRPHSG